MQDGIPEMQDGIPEMHDGHLQCRALRDAHGIRPAPGKVSPR
jgi:hypothetical protein